MPEGYKIRMSGGSHPRLVDYACSSCGQFIPDVFFTSAKSVTDTMTCECGAEADKSFGGRQNFIHMTKSSMYGKYHEGLGCVIDDYAHKQRVMRELGVMEGADPVGGSRNHWKETPERPADLPESTWVENPGDVTL